MNADVLFLHRIICNAAHRAYTTQIGIYSFGNILSTFYSKMDIQLKSKHRASVKTAPAKIERTNERTHILQVFSIFASSHSRPIRCDPIPHQYCFSFWFVPLNSNGSGSLENISNFNYMYFDKYTYDTHNMSSRFFPHPYLFSLKLWRVFYSVCSFSLGTSSFF